MLILWGDNGYVNIMGWHRVC